MSFLNLEKIKKKYSQKNSAWGLNPNQFIVQFSNIANPGTVIDIGVGEGRNGLFLARKGFDVTGIDLIPEAVNRFLGAAKKEKLKVKGVVADIAKYQFNENYDAVICIATLHLAPKSKVPELIVEIKQHTKENGINVITVFTKKDEGYQKYPGLYFFEEDELKSFYADWKILEYKNYIKDETHDGPHHHHLCALIAQKTSS